MISLGKAKNLVEIDSEPGYTDSIVKGLELYGEGSSQNLENLKAWDCKI